MTAPETGAARSNIAKTLLAAVWMYGGRGVGLLWTLALVARLGIGEYGHYAMAFAMAAIAAAPLDNPFNVRAIRESEARFLSERTSRFLVGASLMVAGLALLPVSYIAWFGLVAGGGELVFNTYKSRNLRDGHPDRVMRLDTIRQTSSVALGIGYLFAVPHPTLLGASLLYVAPYFVIAVITALAVRRHAPTLPGPPRLVAGLMAEHLGNALYVQGDVLLLGFMTNSTTAGYYSVTSVFAWAVAALGQSFGATYHEPMRAAAGHLSAGPPLRNTVLLGLSAGLLVLFVGVGLLASPAPPELGVAMMIMAAFCVMRTVNYVFTAILYLQRRDWVRVVSAVGLAPLKLALVVALAPAGAVGAAIASVVTDLVLLVVYTVTLYRRAEP